MRSPLLKVLVTRILPERLLPMGVLSLSDPSGAAAPYGCPLPIKSELAETRLFMIV